MVAQRVAKIYLEEWQRRMIKDILNVECDYCEVHLNDQAKIMKYMGPVVLRYMGPPAMKVDKKRMYFTEWQRSEIKHLFGATREYIELVKNGSICMYRGPLAEKVR